MLESEHVRVATVTARTPMKLVVMTGHDFRAITRDMPEVLRQVREAMQERQGTSAA